jgi:hypothetical protein
MLYKINQFDRIKIRTTKNIKYLSSPDAKMPSPHGIWIVIGNVDTDLLVCKNAAICRVPVGDVIVMGRSKLDHLRELLDGEKRKK